VNSAAGPGADVPASAAERWVLRGERVVTPEGVAARAIHVAGETIARVTAYGEVPSGARVVEAGAAAVLPGLVDTHVHINEPGRTEWEGFATATRAAAAGGVTTLIEMPLNAVPPTTSCGGLEAKRAAAAGQLSVDVGFWGGIVPENAAEIAPLWDAGVFGFKAFLCPSGVDEFPPVDERVLRAALPVLARLGAPLLVHAEDPAVLEQALELECAVEFDERRYACYLATRPARAEVEAVALLIRLARWSGAHIHIVHLACADAVPLLAEARRHGARVSAETCPHYLHLTASDVPEGATAYKCAPPIREAAHREALWAALGEGVVDLIATDHSPCPPALKQAERGDFLAAWGGIASLQLGLAATWTAGAPRGVSLAGLAQWMAAGPARLAGLTGRKGAIAPGCDADLVLFRPDVEQAVSPERLFHRHPVTPYAGRRLRGQVVRTYLRGALVYEAGSPVGAPRGRLLARPTAARPRSTTATTPATRT
jgi:allantoinase